MAQPSISLYFNTRKRVVNEESIAAKNKVFISETKNGLIKKVLRGTCEDITSDLKKDDRTILLQTKNVENKIKSKVSERNICNNSQMQNKNRPKDEIYHIFQAKELKAEEKLDTKKFEFIKKGFLSPKNKKSIENESILEQTKNIKQVDDLKKSVRKELSFDEVKSKVLRSEKLQELKASLNRIKELEKLRKIQESKSKIKQNKETEKQKDLVSLKQFKTIELEVMASPVKEFKSPAKAYSPSTSEKNVLMSPKYTSTRLLFSPDKNVTGGLEATPAFQKYANLTKTPSLLLPFKYKCLVQVFEAVDSVCAMYFNRNESITFKKLKSAVQRLLRKNFSEVHLSQIKSVYPEAYNFQQVKMRNYGSVSKNDYFQLVIIPNINVDFSKPKENKSTQSTPMNPEILTERQKKFHNILLQIVKNEHDRFLKSLDPPLNIPVDQVKRWHPEFDLESCPDIKQSNLPQPPNIEKYSSAKDVLATARNLFRDSNLIPTSTIIKNESNDLPNTEVEGLDKNLKSSMKNPGDGLLKNIPQSLLEKIRNKQASKAQNIITRTLMQENELKKYNRLPELARHLRNVYVTEKKSILALELILQKISNSYNIGLNFMEIENHLKLIAKECPKWVAFHNIRKTVYLKMQKDMDFGHITKQLEKAALENSKC